jgi:hypothetical protein
VRHPGRCEHLAVEPGQDRRAEAVVEETVSADALVGDGHRTVRGDGEPGGELLGCWPTSSGSPFVPWPGRALLQRTFLLLDLGVSMNLPCWREMVTPAGDVVPGINADIAPNRAEAVRWALARISERPA